MSDFPRKVPDRERRDYPGMVTPTELRNIALGLENANHASEELAKLYHDAPRLHRAITSYAGNHYGQLTRDLLAIAGWPHNHVASEGSDECGLCKRDLRHPVHFRAGEQAVDAAHTAHEIARGER